MNLKFLGAVAFFFLSSAWCNQSKRAQEIRGVEGSYSFDSNTQVRVLLDKPTGPFEIRALTHAVASDLKTSSQMLYKFDPRRFDSTIHKKGVSQSVSPSHSSFQLGSFDGTRSFLFQSSVYRGSLSIIAKDGYSLVINETPLSNYLMGVLSGEMSTDWPIEALKAQAVAARTYVLQKMKDRRSSDYDVENSTQDQVFTGLHTIPDRIRKAVEDTQGIVLSNKAQLYLAYYHSRCGGNADNANLIFNHSKDRKSTEKRSVHCSYCTTHPYKWTYEVSPSDFNTRLEFPTNPRAHLRLSSLSLTPGGRLLDLRASNGKAVRKLRAEEMRKILGFNSLKSTRFTWNFRDGQFLFSGIGFGHGVGMCQWGAKDLAEKGRDFKFILKHYYPDAQLSRSKSLVKRFGLNPFLLQPS